MKKIQGVEPRSYEELPDGRAVEVGHEAVATAKEQGADFAIVEGEGVAQLVLYGHGAHAAHLPVVAVGVGEVGAQPCAQHGLYHVLTAVLAVLKPSGG